MNLRRIALIVRASGFAIYFAAMFLPAVHLPDNGGGWFHLPGDNVWGFLCAIFTTMGALPTDHQAGGPFLSEPLRGMAKILAATVNPFTLIYAILCTRKAEIRTLLFFAVAIVTGDVTIHIFLGMAGIRLLIGYYVWSAGIALILVSPAIDRAPAIAGWLRDRRGTRPA